MPLFSLLLILAFPAVAEEPDWGDYAAVLADHVRPVTRHGVRLHGVDYPALARDPRFRRALAAVEGFDPARLDGRAERLAFHINAYNLFALRLVADHWPLASIRDLGHWYRSVWDETAGRLGGRPVTLGHIEHQVLRPMGEPRIHLAIVCASVSCPDLRREPYTAARLEAQLEDRARRFLANPGKGLRLEGGVAHVSSIFDWFAEDFDAVGGVAAFVRRHRPGLAAVPIQADLPYDWSVNAVEAGR